MILRDANDQVILECEAGSRLVSTHQGLVVSEPSGQVRILRRDGTVECLEPARDA